MLLQSVGAMFVPVILGMNRKVYWIWLAIRQYQGILDHCGYEELPLLLDPFSFLSNVGQGQLFGGTKFHDDHHLHFDCNYASCFSIIDTIMGTHYHDLVKRREKK